MASTHSDLASLYNHDMECQVNVAQDGGERVDGDFKGKQWHAWTDHVQTWKPIRIPFNAATDPSFEDTEIKFDLATHAEGIGMTGWDWRSKLSRWVAFDFDAITGHSDKHTKKLTNQELNEVQTIITTIPWVTIRKSTSGSGLHIYVFLYPVSTSNHNEHAALARSILGEMSALTGYDFSSKVDICGGNMWVWHRKMRGTDGLKLIKQGNQLVDVPLNWESHLTVIRGKRKKILPEKITSDDESQRIFDELAGKLTHVPLDEDHKKLIQWLNEHNAVWWWDQDNHMLVTHTIYLAEAHQDLNFKGSFKTIAQGSERGHDHNCFSGNTEILTLDGLKTFKESAMKGREVLLVQTESGLKWIDCEIKSFGIQDTYPILFGDGWICRTTKNHRWITRNQNTRKINLVDKKFTYELIKGRTQLPLAKIDLPPYDEEAYAHGFVFGDGYIVNCRSKLTTSVDLFKRDHDLLKLLCRYGNQGFQRHRNSSDLYHACVRQLPSHWKELPTNPTKSYALGFVLGLVSADGFVDTNTAIFQSDFHVLEEVRKLAIYAGLRVGQVSKYTIGPYPNAKQGYVLRINNYNLTTDHFIRIDQKSNFKIRKKSTATTVSYIDWNTPISEEVFCAVVPYYENFTLGNGIITSNCFCFPVRRGSWIIRRFTPGTKEDPIWDQDGVGYTRCYYNREPDLTTAARHFDGIEHPSGGFVFRHAELAAKTAGLLGTEINLPNWMLGRKTKLKEHRDGRLIAEIDYESHDHADQMQGWLQEKGTWKKIFNTQVSEPTGMELGNYDDVVRHLVTLTGDDYGWMIKSEGSWRSEPLIHVRTALESLGLNPREAKTVLGSSVFKAWTVVNRPFQSEYIGDRTWNRNAPQLRFPINQEKDNLNFPTWLKILNHIGRSLDMGVKDHEWCKSNYIFTGADYLKCWIASLFQHPLDPLPYLFLYGPQNSGKSILHEALALLMTRGCERADTALTSQSGFNGELEHAVLCIIEETDLRRNKVAYNRIKDWVTSVNLPIHKKQHTPYTIPNTTHYIQCGNDHNMCPIFPGDTRITMAHVPLPTDPIPKKQLIQLLEKEASDFITEILALELPVSNDRLAIPVVITDEKLIAEEANQTFLEIFLKECCFYTTGKMIKYSDFYDRFREWLDPNYVHHWTKIRVGRELPPQYPKGRCQQTGQLHIGNISWQPREPDDLILPKLILRKETLIEEITNGNHLNLSGPKGG